MSSPSSQIQQTLRTVARPRPTLPMSLCQCPTSGAIPVYTPAPPRHRHRSATPTRHSLPTPVPTNRSFVLGHGTTYNTLLLYRLHHRGTSNGPIGLAKVTKTKNGIPQRGQKSQATMFSMFPLVRGLGCTWVPRVPMRRLQRCGAGPYSGVPFDGVNR